MANENKKVINIRKGKGNSSPNKKSYTLRDITLGGNNQSLILNSDKTNNLDYNQFFSDEKNTKYITRRTKIPYIKVHEFEPDMLFKFAQHLELISQTIDMVLTSGKQVLDDPIKLFDSFVKSGGIDLGFGGDSDNKKEQAKDKQTDSLVSQFFIDEDSYKDNVISKPIQRYTAFFDAQCINSYEIPYYEDTYMEVNGIDGWDYLNSKDINFGNQFFNAIWNVVANLGIVDTNPIPRWKLDTKSEYQYYNINTEFHLNNKDLKSLSNNFNFLVTLLKGALWVQYDTRFMPSNVYNVEIPGILNLLYAIMNVDVKSVGNKRKLPTIGGNPLEVLTNEEKQYLDLEMITRGGLRNAYYPDAWKVTISFRSLIPNNFNNYLDYLINGSKSLDLDSRRTSGTDQFYDKYFKSGETKGK